MGSVAEEQYQNFQGNLMWQRILRPPCFLNSTLISAALSLHSCRTTPRRRLWRPPGARPRRCPLSVPPPVAPPTLFGSCTSGAPSLWSERLRCSAGWSRWSWRRRGRRQLPGSWRGRRRSWAGWRPMLAATGSRRRRCWLTWRSVSRSCSERWQRCSSSWRQLGPSGRSLQLSGLHWRLRLQTCRHEPAT